MSDLIGALVRDDDAPGDLRDLKRRIDNPAIIDQMEDWLATVASAANTWGEKFLPPYQSTALGIAATAGLALVTTTAPVAYLGAIIGVALFSAGVLSYGRGTMSARESRAKAAAKTIQRLAEALK